jgi:uncharacterized protein YkwD
MFLRRTLSAMLAGVALLAIPAATASAQRRHHARHHRHARHHGHAAASCPNADTPATAATKQDMRAAVVCLINAQRTGRGLPPLDANSRLDRSAQLWTNTMVITGQFTHGADFSARISATGFVWSFAGENIASGFQTPREVVDGWMGSTGHCQNILNPSYADVGTGVDTHPLPGLGPATWTQDFALWMGHTPPSRNTGPMNGCPY